MTEWKWFRNPETGKIGKYPARFASRPSFEEIDSKDASCVGCTVKPKDKAEPKPVTDSDTRTKTTSKKD